MPFPFEVPFAQVEANLDGFVDEVFGALQSEFLNLPKGDGFVDYSTFSKGYEELKATTHDFRDLSPEPIIATICRVPISFIVLRTILGFTPPEWAYITTQRSEVAVPQGAARTVDRSIRMAPLTPLRLNNGVTNSRLRAMVTVACQLLTEPPPSVPRDKIYRLDKADTKHGLASLQPLADMGVPYAMLLYERFLGRPFAGHRDSVSELVGDILESAIEAQLDGAKVSFRKTKRAERVGDFDQAPDFIVPDEYNPEIVIEAKLQKMTALRVTKSRAYSISLASLCGAELSPIRPVRGDRLHRWSRIRCASRRYEKTFAGDTGKGLHIAEHAPVN